MTTITEADVEQAGLAWLAGIGWRIAHGRDIAPDEPNAERADYGQVVLEQRLRDPLTSHRGALLPKLVSGEIRIGESHREASS